jgi:hypothetical protein
MSRLIQVIAPHRRVPRILGATLATPSGGYPCRWSCRPRLRLSEGGVRVDRRA